MLTEIRHNLDVDDAEVCLLRTQNGESVGAQRVASFGLGVV